jgi:hypothetical protein
MWPTEKHELADALAESLFGIFPTDGRGHAPAEAQQHGQIAAVLDDFCAAALFARQFAQFRPDRREQLDDDRRADVGHDADRADGATLQRAAGEHIVPCPSRRRCHAAFLRKILPAPCRPDRESDEGNQPATASTHSVNQIRDFSSGILKQLANVLKMLRNMNQSGVRLWRRRVCG